jgi:hypothetical protein
VPKLGRNRRCELPMYVGVGPVQSHSVLSVVFAHRVVWTARLRVRLVPGLLSQ